MANDTSEKEKQAEDLISSMLQRHGLLVAKPKFDRLGSDLLALLEIDDLARVCRIQSKYRSLVNRGEEVKIPASYISDGLVVFVFVETGDRSETNLFCFLPNDVVKWNLRGTEYVLSLSRQRLGELKPCEFTDARAKELRKQIGLLFAKTIHSLTVPVCDTATIGLDDQVFVSKWDENGRPIID